MVAESDKGCVLWVGVMEDRAVVVTRSKFVNGVRVITDQVQDPARLMDSEIRNKLVEVCGVDVRGDTASRVYLGRKYYCDSDMLVSDSDPNVCKLNPDNASEAIRHLASVGIPDDPKYLLAEGTAFAYFTDGVPVAFAGTHPTGAMSDRIGNVMVGTLGMYRGRGCGRAVIAATTHAVVCRGKVAVWGMSHDNLPAMRTASSRATTLL